MATINISMNQILDYGAQRYLTWKQPAITQEERARAMPAARYDMMVHAFHVGTALLVGAVAMAILAKFAVALVIGAIGFFIRTTIERELDGMALPEREAQGVHNVMDRLMGRRHADAAVNILRQMGVNAAGWNPDRVVVCDHVLVKNYMPAQPAAAR